MDSKYEILLKEKILYKGIRGKVFVPNYALMVRRKIQHF